MTRPTPLFVRALTKAAGMPVGAGGRLDWRRLVADAGLSVIALHEDLGTIESEPHAVVERARRFGARFVVVTGMHRFDYSRVTFLIGFVIGPQFELSLRQSIIISSGDVSVLGKHPIALAIVVIALGAGLYFMRSGRERAS